MINASLNAPIHASPNAPTGDAPLWVARLDPAALADLRPADDFVAIVRTPRLAACLDATLAEGGRVVAAVAGDRLVGYASVVPFRPVVWENDLLHRRWEALPCALELGALEVARSYRRRGLAGRLLAAVEADGSYDGHVLIGEALAWHWDIEHAGVPLRAYRGFLLRLLERVGFRAFATDAPEVVECPQSFLAARIGASVPAEARAAFEALLHVSH